MGTYGVLVLAGGQVLLSLLTLLIICNAKKLGETMSSLRVKADLLLLELASRKCTTSGNVSI